MTERRAYEDRQALMVRELHHRVKSTLATVQAVVNATVRSSLTVPEFTRAVSGLTLPLFTPVHNQSPFWFWFWLDRVANAFGVSPPRLV